MVIGIHEHTLCPKALFYLSLNFFCFFGIGAVGWMIWKRSTRYQINLVLNAAEWWKSSRHLIGKTSSNSCNKSRTTLGSKEVKSLVESWTSLCKSTKNGVVVFLTSLKSLLFTINTHFVVAVLYVQEALCGWMV